MVTMQMNDVIGLVGSEAARLSNFLSGISEQDWGRQSACEGWVIGDVAAHLAGGAGSWATNITRALAGDADPPEGQGFLAAGERGSEGTAQAARAAHQRVGPGLLEDFTTGYQRLAQFLSQLTAEDWEKPCFHRRAPMPVRDYVSLRVQELTVHGWDIRSGLDPSAELSEEPLSWLVQTAPRWLRNAFSPGLDLPSPGRYRFDISGPVPVQEDVLVNGDGFRTEPPTGDQADATFQGNTGNYILLIYGRLDVGRAIESGRLSISGGQDRASDFTAWFRGF